MRNKIANQLLKHQQSADQGLMIRSLVTEDLMGETDCSNALKGNYTIAKENRQNNYKKTSPKPP